MSLRRHWKASDWAQCLVDNVATATQLDPDKGELANVDDWRRNAESLFKQILAMVALDPVLAMASDPK